MFDLEYLRCAAERSRKSQDGPPEMQVDLTDELEEAIAEIERLRSENAALTKLAQDARDAFHRMNSPTGREIELQRQLEAEYDLRGAPRSAPPGASEHLVCALRKLVQADWYYRLNPDEADALKLEFLQLQRQLAESETKGGA
jgi:hypothetical protein